MLFPPKGSRCPRDFSILPAILWPLLVLPTAQIRRSGILQYSNTQAVGNQVHHFVYQFVGIQDGARDTTYFNGGFQLLSTFGNLAFQCSCRVSSREIMRLKWMANSPTSSVALTLARNLRSPFPPCSKLRLFYGWGRKRSGRAAELSLPQQ